MPENNHPVTFDDIDIDAIIDAAAAKTDAELIGQISSLTRMTDEEITTLFPKQTDAKRLVELMQIVRSSQTENTKRNQLIANSEQFAGTILKLLVKFV